MKIESVKLPQLKAIISFTAIEVSTNKSRSTIGLPNGGTLPGTSPLVSSANSSFVANRTFLLLTHS